MLRASRPPNALLDAIVAIAPTAPIGDSHFVARGKKNEKLTLIDFDQLRTRWRVALVFAPPNPRTRDAWQNCLRYPIASPPDKPSRNELPSPRSSSLMTSQLCTETRSDSLFGNSV